MGWDNEILLAILAAITGGFAWVAKLLVKIFRRKEADIKKLREEKHALEINKAVYEDRLMKHAAKSRKRKKE